jgi:hypothetical protein
MPPATSRFSKTVPATPFKASSAAAVGQVAGNKVKLECLYTREQVQGLAEGGLTRLWDDLAAKERELAEALAG